MLNFDIFQEFKYDPKTKRYRVKSGVGKSQFISKEAFLFQTQKHLDSNREKLIALHTETSDLNEFQRLAAEYLKEINVSSAIIAANGVENLNTDDFLQIGRHLKQQYYSGKDPVTGDRYGLKHLAKEIANGEVSEAQLKNRLDLYSQSHKNIFWEIIAKKQGKPYAKRNLNSVVPCAECIAYSHLPPMAVSKIIKPTQRCSCKNRCMCTLTFLSLEEAVKAGMQED